MSDDLQPISRIEVRSMCWTRVEPWDTYVWRTVDCILVRLLQLSVSFQLVVTEVRVAGFGALLKFFSVARGQLEISRGQATTS